MTKAQKRAQPTLAGYLAVHHHKNNMAMLIVNPSARVRLLLSCVIFGLREDLGRLTAGMRYRAIISLCGQEASKITASFRRGEIDGDEAKRLVFMYLDKAALATAKLKELTNGGN